MKRAARLAVTAGVFVAAGVGAKLVDDRRRTRRRLDRGDDVPFGSVHSAPVVLRAHDGVLLHAEVDEIDDHDPDHDVTVVFLHGWMCTLDTWHYQRLALRGRVRMAFLDLRSHGGSGRSDASSSSLGDLAQDLGTLLDELVPTGAVVLVGHSMGGMTIQRLAIDQPQWFADRVRGVALIGTSGGRLMRSSPALRRLVPLLRLAAPAMDWGRSFNSYSIVRRWALGPDAEPRHVDMVDEMILRAPTHVVFDFYRNFVGLDLTSGHEVVGRARTVVVGGTEDQLTPFSHSERLVAGIDGSTLVRLERAGHMMMFEDHEAVTEAVEDLVDAVRKDLTD